MGILDDTSLDARMAAVIKAKKRKATTELYEEATLIEEDPSPAMLDATAIWLEILDDLRDAGFTEAELCRGTVRASKNTVGIHGPSTDLLIHVFSVPEGLAIARAVADELLAIARPYDKRSSLVLARMAQAGEIEERFDALFDLDHDRSTLRAILGAIPAARREALLLRHAVPIVEHDVDKARRALWIVGQLLDAGEYATTPAVIAARDAALAAAKGHADYQRLADEVARGVARVVHPRPTPRALRAMAHWTGKDVKVRRTVELGPLAQRVYTERDITVAAPELASMATWIACGAKRQKQIATSVVAAMKKHTGENTKLVDIEHGIALIDMDGLRFCLVPGGTFELGFSDEEDGAVRAQAETRAGCPNHYELYDSLLDRVDLMRPVQTIRVGPLLAMQGIGESYELEEAAEVLENSMLRVPSEAEWEYLARGGASRQLTYRGDVVPDDPADFRSRNSDKNGFRMWGFGVEPELCADVYAETHDGIPLDGTPRLGDGPRVVRGGAGQLFPWQDTGEWHLLLSAMRVSQEMWEFVIALRWVLGIRIA